MPIDTLNAKTQYNDLTGTAAIDGHGSAELRKLMESHGLDASNWFPIGIGLYHWEGFDSVYVLAVPDAQTHEEAAAYINRQTGPVPATRFLLPNLDVAGYLKLIKRFTVETRIDAAKHVAQFDITEVG